MKNALALLLVVFIFFPYGARRRVVRRVYRPVRPPVATYRVVVPRRPVLRLTAPGVVYGYSHCGPWGCY